MKKHIKYILVFLLIIVLFIGCSNKKVENVREKDIFNIKTATSIVEGYLKNISSEKYDKANELLSEKVKTNITDIKPTDLKIKGYRIEEIDETADEGNFKINISKSNINKPEAQLLEYRIKVIKDGIDYKIDEIKVSNLKGVLKEFDELRLRRENEIETYLITDMAGLPEYAYSKDDTANFKNYIVPKKNYGMILLNYTGDKIALSTKGGNLYIGILSFSDTEQTQGGNKGQSQGEGEGDSGETKMQQGKTIKEKPIGKQILSCDIILGDNVQNMAFSKDEKLLLVQYKKDNNRCIRVYNTDSGELIPVKFEEEYPINKVDVLFESFEKEKMIFKVVPKSGEKKDTTYIGNWEMDIKSFKVTKSKS